MEHGQIVDDAALSNIFKMPSAQPSRGLAHTQLNIEKVGIDLNK
jgi:hypothetical protein